MRKSRDRCSNYKPGNISNVWLGIDECHCFGDDHRLDTESGNSMPSAAGQSMGIAVMVAIPQSYFQPQDHLARIAMIGAVTARLVWRATLTISIVFSVTGANFIDDRLGTLKPPRRTVGSRASGERNGRRLARRSRRRSGPCCRRVRKRARPISKRMRRTGSPESRSPS